MFSQVRKQVERYEEIERLLAEPSIVSDPAKYAPLMKERGQILRIVTRYRDLEKISQQKKEAETLLNEHGDEPELKKMAQEEISQLKQKEEQLVAELEEIVLMDDAQAQSNVIVEIRPGTGGEESALFSADLLRMYTKYAERRGWTLQILELTHTDLGGIKQVSFSVEGTDVYKYLRYESGGHRVQRVPRTEAQGRIHTSACTVAVLPEAEDVDVNIRKEDLRIDTYCAGGPGGQHVNKTASAVRITHLPTNLVVACQTERSQHRNRDLAMKWLRAKLYEHFLTQKKTERDSMRRQQIGSGDRSEKIRTYNFPQSRITDHRIGLSLHNLQTVLDGNLDELIAKLREHDKEEKLKQLARAS